MAEDITKLTNKTIDEGGVLALLYFDIHGNSKEAVQEVGTAFIQQILEREGVVYALGEIEEPVESIEKENKDGKYSTHIEVKILTKNFYYLTVICAINSPFNIEILRPDRINMDVAQAHELLATISTTTAEYKSHIIRKLSTPEDADRYTEYMKKRAEMGRAILEKKDGV